MLPLIIQYLAFERMNQIIGMFRFILAMGISQRDHFFTETGVMTAPRIDQNNLAMGGGMLLDKTG
jgi:hypothetical protein